MERIAVQKEADEIFQRNEKEKEVRRRKNAEGVSVFRVQQAVRRSKPKLEIAVCMM